MKSRKKLFVGTAIVASLATAGAAYAFVTTTTTSGRGTATVSNKQPVTLTAEADAELVPGSLAATPITITATNPATFEQAIGNVTVVADGFDNGLGGKDAIPAVCGFVITQPLTLSAPGYTVPQAGLTILGATIRMPLTDVDQTACVGRTILLKVTTAP